MIIRRTRKFKFMIEGKLVDFEMASDFDMEKKAYTDTPEEKLRAREQAKIYYIRRNTKMINNKLIVPELAPDVDVVEVLD